MPILRRLPLLAVAPLLVACTSWSGRPVPSAGSESTVRYEHPIRVVRADQSTLVMDHARVERDSLVGDVGSPPERRAIAVADVRQVEERKVSALRTGGLALGIGIAALAVLTVAAFAALMASWN